jgi:hypothetical protein
MCHLSTILLVSPTGNTSLTFPASRSQPGDHRILVLIRRCDFGVPVTTAAPRRGPPRQTSATSEDIFARPRAPPSVKPYQSHGQ